MVIEINDSNFDAFIDGNKYVIVDFWAPWCGPCKRIAPVMEELSRELEGAVAVAKLNVDESPGISARFSVTSIPTIMLFKDGVMVQSLIGLRSKNDLMAAMASRGMVAPRGSSKPAAAPPNGFPEGEPVEVTDANFDAFIASKTLVLVDCWAPWCGPCRRIAPIIEALAKDAGGIAVGKLNTDENRGVMMRFGIEAIPTILMFKEGKLVDTVVGLAPDMSAESLKSHMKRL